MINQGQNAAEHSKCTSSESSDADNSVEIFLDYSWAGDKKWLQYFLKLSVQS